MRGFRLVLCGGLLSGCLSAAPPGGVAALLAGHTLRYEATEGTEPDLQSWKADGSTIFHTYGLGRSPRSGVWRVEGRRYCSDFGDPGRPRTWNCYRVKVLENGALVEFDEIGDPFALIQFTRDWRGRFVE